MTAERSTQAMTWRMRPAEQATIITARRTAVVLLTGLFFWMAPPVEAVPSFMGLGVPDKLTPNDNVSDPIATAISADGSTVVGTVRATLHGVPGIFAAPVATRWTQATGQTFIALPPITGAPGNDYPRFATGVSANGSVIVARGDGTRFFQSSGATGTAIFFDSELLLQTIGGISGDGSTIVGSARALGTNDSFAYRLTGTTLADLELLPNPGGATGSAGASIVSSDGSVVLGTFQGAATLWNGSSPRLAPTAPGGEALGPRDVTGDGSIVVGGSLAGAFLWSTASDTVEILDPLPLGNGRTTTFVDFAKAVSDDGSRTIGIAGDGFSSISSSSVLWDENNQPHKINTLLPDIGLEAAIAGWDLGTIVDISADGRTILGNGTNPAGKQESWIAVVEEIPMLPDVFWVGRNGDNLWHSDTGTQTNWSDKPDNTGISVTPPGADGTTAVRISGDAVFLNNTPPGQAVTSIASIFADNSFALFLNAPLALGSISSARRVTINSDLITESQFRLLGPNTWQSGTISGSAANVASGASRVLLSGPATTLAIDGDRSLDTNLTLQDFSGVTHSDGILTVANGAAITVGPDSLYTIDAGKIVSGQPIVNQGEFAKSSLANEVIIQGPFTLENGTISAGEGTLTFTGTQSHQGGAYEPSAGATIQFLNTLTAVSDTVTATGGGNVALVGGIYSVSIDDTATFNLSGPEGLDIQGVTVEAIGTVTNNGKATFQSGVLEGGQVNANNTVFEGGFVNDTLGDFVITGGNNKRIKGIVQNSGDITQQDGTTLRIEDGGAIVNLVGGTYKAVGNSQINFIGTAGRFENAGGTFETTEATGQSASTFVVDTPFNVSAGGEVKVAVDTDLILSGGGNHTGTGTFDVAGTLILEDIHTFDGNFSIEGNGETQVLHAALAGGQVVVSKGHSLSFRVGVSTLTSTGGTLVIEGGTLSDFAGTFNWDQGTISAPNAPAGTDALVNRGGQVVIEDMGSSIMPPVLSNATMRNTANGVKQGEVTQKGDIVLESGVIINDTGGVWRSEALSETTILNLDTDNRFVNSGGTFIKTGSETANILVRFNLNKGTVRVDEGTLSLRGGSLSGDSVPFATGDFQIAAGAVLEMPNSFYRFDGVYEATGEGTFLINGTSEFQVSDLFTLNLTGVGKAVFEGESVGGVGGLLINKGNAEWRSGFLEDFRNDTGATLKIVAGPAGSDPKRFNALITDNKGIIDHALGVTVDIGDGITGGGDLTNSGVYNLRGELSLANPLDTPITFQNQVGGRFNLAQPGVQRTYEGRFINNGSVEAAANSTLRLLDVPDNLQTHNGNPNGLLANGRWIANAGSKIQLNGVNAGRIARNEANITLRGDGRITNLPDADQGDSNLNLDNAGTLRLLESTIYRVPGDFVNSGTLEVDATSSLFIAGDFESQSGSNITVNNLLNAQGSFINNGGAFSGSGSVISMGFNNVAGTINPGNSPGTMTIMSDYTHGVAATFESEIGGLVAGTGYDQLIIEGDATLLGGTLSLLLFGGFGPEMGQTFDVMLADTISGTFDTITQPSFMGQPVFGVSVVDLVGGTQQALRVTALQTVPVPEPGTFAVVLAGLIGASARRRQHFISRH